MSFSQALSGLNGASDNLKVIGNNIANSQTTGFKSSTVQFADVYANSKIGLGTRVAGVLQNFNEGNLESTGRNLDIAITGSGFLQFEQDNQIAFSRNGQLVMTPEGYLENAQGGRLIGESGVIRIPSQGMVANATTEISASLILDSREPVIAAAFDPTNPDTYTNANTINTYDSLGNMHSITAYYVKTGVNEWTVHTALDGVPSASAPQVLSFTSNGTLTGYAPSNFEFTMTNGADDLNFSLDFTGTQQFGNDFTLNALNQNGYTNGSMVGVTIDKDGSILGNYSNEQTLVLGNIQLANFRNPEGLKPAGDNVWLQTTASGQPLTGVPGSGLFGSIQSQALEASNVDMTKELVNMIIAQRTFQANAQTVKTQDEVLQQAVNLR